MFPLRPMKAVALAAVAVLLPAATAHAEAPARAPDAPCSSGAATAQFGATTNRPGVVDLYYRSAPMGSSIAYFECIGTRARLLGTRPAQPGLLTSLMAATVWRCGRLERRFAAILTAPDGTIVRGRSSARTPSCARRFALRLPRRIAPGRLAHVRVVDRWGIGAIRTTLCITPPQNRRVCRDVTFAAAANVATRRVRLRSGGRWRVELRVRRYRVRDSIAVGAVTDAAPRPRQTVLATGDSTMQGVESFLSDDLGDDATVVSDVRPGSGMSKDDGWPSIARAQAIRLRPRATVVSIGAAEGYPMRGRDGATHECCDEPWIAEYTRRVRTTMLAYRRGGRGRVLWMTLPAPRDPRAMTTFAAVNHAIERAAHGLAGARVLRMDRLFTPDGYRDVMRYRGRDVRVRETDGIHLNISGQAIAAREVARALRGAKR